MKKQDLDQAFAPTPDIVRHRIYQAFRQGEQRARRRKRTLRMVAASAAALLIALVSMGLLLSKTLRPARPDRLLHQGMVSPTGGLSTDAPTATAPQTAAPAATPQMTAQPTLEPAGPDTQALPTSKDEPPYESEDFQSQETANTLIPLKLYYTPNGLHYHTLKDCSGMKNADAHTAGDALASGKVACPYCFLFDPNRSDHLSELMITLFEQCLEVGYPFPRNPAQESVFATSKSNTASFNYEDTADIVDNTAVYDADITAGNGTVTAEPYDGLSITLDRLSGEMNVELRMADPEQLLRFMDACQQPLIHKGCQDVSQTIRLLDNNVQPRALSIVFITPDPLYLPTPRSAVFLFMDAQSPDDAQAAIYAEYDLIEQRFLSISWL